MVPLYRHDVFAQIKPSTNSRIDLGLCFTTYKGKLPKRLIDTGGLAKKDRITHRIEVTSANQIDADLAKWLKVAYSLDVQMEISRDTQTTKIRWRFAGKMRYELVCVH
jgi:hypothetical protein